MTIDEIVPNAIYRIGGVVKERERLFQVVFAKAEEGDIVALVPCIGGTALPVLKEGLAKGLESGEVTMTLEETP